MSQQIKFAVSRFCLIATILFATVGCDQVTKAVVRDSLPVTGTISYFNNSVRFQLAHNPGAFLNLGATLSVSQRFWVFNIATAIILLIVAFMLFNKRPMRPMNLVGLALILGGGIGNLIDRFAFGQVTDFMIVDLGTFHTGVFNVADFAIMLGVGLLALGTTGFSSFTTGEGSHRA